MNQLVLRYSSIEDCLNKHTGCPRRFFNQYIKKAPQKSTPEIDEGNAAHTVLQKWHEENHEIDVYTTVLEECLKYPTLDLKNAQNVLPMVLGYMKRFTPDGHEATIYLERKLIVNIGDVEFSGTPDYLAVYPTGSARLLDYKTGRLKLHTMQMKVYGWLAKLHYGITELTAEKYYLRDATMGGQEYMQEEEFKEAGEWVLNGINAIKGMLEKGEKGFPAKANYFCQFCDVAYNCPLAEKNAKVLNSQPVPTDLSKQVEEYLVFKARFKRIEDSLKQHVKEKGNITMSGTEIGYFEAAAGETVSSALEFMGVLKNESERLEALGMPLSSLLNINTVKFDQLMRKVRKKDTELLMKIERHLVPKPVRRTWTAKLISEAKEA